MGRATPMWGLYSRDGGVCWLCQGRVPYPGTVQVNSPLSATRDHVVPRREGGEVLGDGNLRLAHFLCNQYRDMYAPSDLRKVIDWINGGLRKEVALAAVEPVAPRFVGPRTGLSSLARNQMRLYFPMTFTYKDAAP